MPEYPADERETLAEAPGLRVRLLGLSAGQCVPWHYHNHITDRFFCMRGPMVVETRSPEARHLLQAGDTVAIPPGVPHFVKGHGGACRFMIVQGVGEYDYVPSLGSAGG
jgi:quercetin dioxygenase-like cupin family protein